MAGKKPVKTVSKSQPGRPTRKMVVSWEPNLKIRMESISE